MSAPIKPWERVGVNQQAFSQTQSNAMSSNLPPCCQGGGGGGPGMTADARAPPPVPTRPSLQATTGSAYRPGYSTGYSGLGYNSFGYGGGYGGMYGGYGGYGYSGIGYGGYRPGMGPEPPNSFVRIAEESSRPAFQSIENIVQAVTSVSMMLDSTYQAVYNSFRAVLGVADNFTRMKTHFAQVLSALAFVRTLRYLFRKLLVFLRLRPAGYEEDAWLQAADEAMATAAVNKKSKTSWPILMFFGIILGGPWMIWKLVSSITSSPSEGASEWASGEEDHVVAQAEFTFTADGNEELSFKQGDKIIVAPREQQPRVKGWLLASIDGQKVGYVPANYVKILGKRRGRKYQMPVTGQQSSVPVPMDQSLPSSQAVTHGQEDKPCCHGDNKPGPAPSSQIEDLAAGEVLDSAFANSSNPLDDTIPYGSETSELEAGEFLERQTKE